MTGLERSIAVIGEHARRVEVLLHDAAHPDKKPHPYALHQTPAPVITVPRDARVVIEPEHTITLGTAINHDGNTGDGSEPAHSTTAAQEPVQFGEDASTHGGQIDGNTATGPTAPDLAPTSNS